MIRYVRIYINRTKEDFLKRPWPKEMFDIPPAYVYYRPDCIWTSLRKLALKMIV
jgi:hypothetical protein